MQINVEEILNDQQDLIFTEKIKKKRYENLTVDVFMDVFFNR